MARLLPSIVPPEEREPEPPGCIFCFEPVNAQHRYDCLTERERREEEYQRKIAGPLLVMFNCGVLYVQPGTVWHRAAVKLMPRG